MTFIKRASKCDEDLIRLAKNLRHHLDQLNSELHAVRYGGEGTPCAGCYQAVIDFDEWVGTRGGA